MATYAYHEMDGSRQRNKNITVTVYRIKNNRPERLGESHENSASYRGAKAVAARMIADKEGYNLKDRGYGRDPFQRDDVRLYELK
jgi:hypothetical protein